jgi:hypothetical protein
MDSGSLKSIYWTHRSRNYNLVSHLLIVPLEKNFTVPNASTLNSRHWGSTELFEWFLPSPSESPTVSITVSIRVKLQSLTRNVFHCSLLLKHVLFWVAIWLVTDLFVVAENRLAKPLPSYSRIFWFQYSGFQAARHNIFFSVCHIRFSVCTYTSTTTTCSHGNEFTCNDRGTVENGLFYTVRAAAIDWGWMRQITISQRKRREHISWWSPLIRPVTRKRLCMHIEKTKLQWFVKCGH